MVVNEEMSENTEQLGQENSDIEQKEEIANGNAKTDVKDDQVPLKTMLDYKTSSKKYKKQANEYKQQANKYKAKLDAYETAERQKQEQELQKKGEFKELLAKKEEQIAELVNSLENEQKQRKKDLIVSKATNLLIKSNVIDANDALKILDVADLVGDEMAEVKLQDRIEDLKKNKSYLFLKNSSIRDEHENSVPKTNKNVEISNSKTKQRRPMTPIEKATEMLMDM
jgi:hypothetical protein